MSRFSNIKISGQRWLALQTHKRVLPLNGDKGVISFTFDDAPHSACNFGAAVLENHGCLATWYVSGGLTDQVEAGNMCHSQSDLLKLHHHGHQIGCHTYSHLACVDHGTQNLTADMDRNREYLGELKLLNSELHFSYPFGRLNPRVKELAGSRYTTCRITGGGLQTQYADLNALKSEKLYQRIHTKESLNSLADITAKQRGWLIFYTHDIQENHSPWGCKISMLEHAVVAALKSGCQVMTVQHALNYWKSFAHNSR